MIDEALSNNELMLPEIGLSVLGGFFAGLININGQTRGVIVSPKATGEYRGPWDASDTRISGAACPVDGQQNTRDMILARTQLGLWAQSLNINGFSDWFIPSKDEVCFIFQAFGQKNQVQSSAGGGLELFDGAWYWTSTQVEGLDVSVQHLHLGYQSYDSRRSFYRARAVRTIDLSDLVIQ